MNLRPSKYCYESVLMREQTGVPGENPGSLVVNLSALTTFVVEVGALYTSL